MRPLTDSRSLRVFVARGSIAYSAVTQPSPLPRRQRGTSSATLAAHSTRVAPNSTSTDPSAWSSHPRVNRTGRSASAARPSGRDMRSTLPGALLSGGGRREVDRLAREGDLEVAAEGGRGLGERVIRLVPRLQVRQHHLPGTRPRRVLAG